MKIQKVAKFSSNPSCIDVLTPVHMCSESTLTADI